MRGKDDLTVLDIMQHRMQKYMDHHIQKEFLQILVLGHLRKIATSIRECFSLEAVEVTDTSNKEQLVVCLRWVDSQFEPHEKFIGLYHIEDITAETTVAVLKDTILRMNSNLSMCRSQCCGGAGNMKRVAREIEAIELMALYLHCYGHSLNFAVADTLKEVKPMADTLDRALEICKFSPRRDAIFNKLEQEITPGVPGLCTLCPTRWTVHAASLESIHLNYTTLMATCEEALDVAKQSELKARINGVAAKMSDFDFLFCLMLAELLLRHCNNLSKTIQRSSMPS